MRVLWTVFKIVIGLALAIPVGILVLALTVGTIGALIGIAIMTLKLACIALIGYGLYRVARFAFRPSPKKVATPRAELPAPDPYYESAMRELDFELGDSPRR
jgi:hypothetical protein